MTKRKATGDYEVGYGRPPKHSRFARGQSGNPKGRPRAADKNLSAIFAAKFREPVTIRQGGQERRVSFFEAMAERLMLQAINGNVRACNVVLTLAKEYRLLEPQQMRMLVQFVYPEGSTADPKSPGAHEKQPPVSEG